MSYITQKGTVDENNGTTTPLTNGQTFTGLTTDVSKYNTVVVAVKTDKSGILYIDFSPDGSNWDSALAFIITANINEVHRITVTRKFFRVRIYNNSGESQTFLRAQSLLGSQQSLTSSLNSTIQTDADAIVSRSVLTGATDNGGYKNVPVTNEGHLEVAIHEPLLPFGSLHVENLTPIFQGDAVYGLSAEVLTTSRGTATVIGTNNLFKCSTGVGGIGAFSTLQSRKRLRYRAGQGMVCRYTALFSTPSNDSYALAGCGTSETGFYFGYVDGIFGIFHVKGGVREIRTLTITTPSTATNNYQITLNGTVNTVTATNNNNILRTAYEISRGTYIGWKAEARGSTVVFLSDSVGPAAGAFSIAQSGAGTPAVGSFATTTGGSSGIDTFVAQADWNGDKLDGNGSSGSTLNPIYGNIYSIHMTYLGFGPIVFKVRVISNDSNNATDVVVHTIKYPNTSTTTNMSQPSLPFSLIAYSTGSTDDVYVATASYAGFVEGQLRYNGPRETYEDISTAVSTSAYYTLITIRNSLVYKGRANQSTVKLMSIGGAHDDTTPVILYAIKNAILVGNPNFIQHSTDSCTYTDSDATTCTITDNSQLILSIPTGDAGSNIFGFEDDVVLQPGESITLAAKTVTGTSTYTIMSLNTREDQ